jgi:type II secretory pathway component GspD/PulD (secretin)
VIRNGRQQARHGETKAGGSLRLAFMTAGLGAALGASLALGTTAAAQQQNVEKDMQKVRTERDAKMMSNPVTTFYLKYSSSANDTVEIMTALHELMQPDVRFYLDLGSRSISMRGFPDDVTAAGNLIKELDRPRKNYRLAFTLNVMEGGKRLDIQHVIMTPASSQRMTLKRGTRVPVVTMSSGTPATAGKPATPPQPQTSYLDVGLNFEVTVVDTADGGELRFRLEQSAVADDKPVPEGQSPTIRTSDLEGVTLLTAGKPLMLGSLDMPGLGARMDVELTLTAVQ